MKIARWISIVITAAGALMLAVPHDESFDTVPFPTAGLNIKMAADIARDGDYHLVTAMPKVGEELGLSEESVPCALAITLKGPGHTAITNQITSISRYAEFGFGRIQYYKSSNWRMDKGKYEISIASSENCQAAVSRGATLSIERDVSRVTERFLLALLTHWSGIALLSIGLLGLVLSELRRVSKPPQSTATAPAN